MPLHYLTPVPVEKQWALPYKNQADFEIEFLKRNPRADTIPDRKKWLWDEVRPENRGIDPFEESDMEIDTSDSRMRKRSDADKDITCMGCGTRFSVRIARISHERSCAKILEMRGENGKANSLDAGE